MPRLTRHFAQDDKSAATQTMDDGIGLAMAFTLPAALALFIMPFFIIDATVTRGAFTHADAHRTAEVLRMFAWGAPAFVLAKVLTPPYFARQRSKQPMQFAIATVLANTAIGASLWFFLPTIGVDGAIGLAVATSITGWLNVFLLSSTLAREGVYRMSGAAWGRMARLGAACAVMGAFIAVCAWQYPMLSKLLWRKEVAIVVVGLSGVVLFGIAALAFRAVSLSEIRGALRREKGAPGVETGGLDG